MAFNDHIQLAHDLRALLGGLRRRLRERGSVGDLKPSQVDVIRRLDRAGPATVSALARDAGLRSQTMGAIVAELTAEGLIDSEPDPDDRRQTLLSLTPLCRERLESGRAAHDDWLVQRFDRLTPAQREQVAAAITILRDIAEN